MKKHLGFCLALLIATTGFAQRGKGGAKTITAAATIVNEYTHLTADAASGSTSLTVNASGLNVNNRFAGTLAAGDLLFIYQAQGAKLNGVINNPAAPLFGLPNDSSWGGVVSYENCGLYEFQEVSAVPNATTIALDCSLKNSYSDTGLVEVIRVPRYSTLTINAAGVITAQPWNGALGEGGIVVLEVLGNTVINGKIDVSGLGFRGATEIDNNSNYGGGYWAAISPGTNGEGEQKGESIGGFGVKYDPLGGHRCNGAPANGGGGGRCHNAGGGGGSNAGVVANWDGKGMPDNSVATYTTCWNLELPGLAAQTSSGGGRGGYTFASNQKDPTLFGPGNATNQVWGGDFRRVAGGLGGRPLDYSTGRVFFGGGGGAGDQDNNVGGIGSPGGGIIYLMNYGTITGANGQVNANGNAGGNTPSSIFAPGIDGAGGAGGGGVVIVNSVGAVSGFTASANGGVGGNQVVNNSVTESEGPGGGGGGGYIAISNGAIVQTANGGANGTTNSACFNPKFPANGATKGAVGITSQPISSFTITTKTDSICAGQTATLNATLNGTTPPGTTILWYTTATGGASVGSGPAFTTPVINAQTIYYAGTCPGTFRVADTIKIVPPPTASAGLNVTVCGGGSTTLTATGGVTYSWTPGGTLSSTTTAVTTATPTVNTTYTVTVTSSSGCSNTATVSVSIGGGGVSPTASAAQTILCQGKSTLLSATGGVTYSWSPSGGLSASNIANPTATPAASATYIVTVTNGSGCTGTATASITVNSRPTANAGTNVAECAGLGTALNASGGGTYSWSPAAGLSNASIFNPTATEASNTTFTVTVVDGNGCRDSATVNLVVNQKPAVVTGPAAGICTGGNTVLNASGATSYTWTPATGLSFSNISNPTASPASTQTYTVTGTDVNGCVNTDTVTVSVGTNITLNISGSTSFCQGAPGGTVVSAGGATSYTWTPSAGLSSSTVSNPTFTPSSSQTYTVTGTTGSCSGTQVVNITVNTLPVANAGLDVAYCPGGSTVLAGTGGGAYSWSPALGLSSTTIANPTANPASTNTYTLTVTDINGCKNAADVTITVNQLPTILISGNLVSCAGTGTTLTASGANSYSWTPGTGLTSSTTAVTTADPLGTMTYTVTGVDVNSCTNFASATITVDTPPRVSVSAAITTGCTPFCVNLAAIDSNGSCSTVLYTYGDGNTGSSQNHCYSTAGTYPVSFTCTDSHGCSGSVTNPAYIHVTPAPVAAFTASEGLTVTYSGSKPDSTCFLNTSTGATSWSWNFGNGTTSARQQPCVAYADSGTYCVSLTAMNGASCQNTANVCVHLEQVAEAAYTIPNVFSPNNDGKNDFFFIKNSGLKSLVCTIYDRWGMKMNEFSALNGQWDGNTPGGGKATDGVYYYVINIQTLSGQTREEKGFVQLWR